MAEELSIAAEESSLLDEIRVRFIDSAGQTTQSLGSGRVLGQVYASLYLSEEPQSLDRVTESLGISKGSASMTLRQLESWGAVRKIWVKGDRKDYYLANDEWGRITRKALHDMVGQKLRESNALLEEAGRLLDEEDPDRRNKRWHFYRQRLNRFQSFRERAEWLWEKFIQGILMR